MNNIFTIYLLLLSFLSADIPISHKIDLYQQFIVDAGTKAWTCHLREIDNLCESLVHSYFDPLIFNV